MPPSERKRNPTACIADLRKGARTTSRIPDIGIDTSTIASTIQSFNPFRDTSSTLPRYSQICTEVSAKPTERSPLYESAALNSQRFRAVSHAVTSSIKSSYSGSTKSSETLVDSKEKLPDYSLIHNYGSTSTTTRSLGSVRDRASSNMRTAGAGCSSSSRTVSRSASGLNFNDPRYLVTRSQPSLAANHCLVEINEEEEEGGFKTAKGKQIGRDIEETSNALTDAVGKVLHRGENLQHLRSTTNRLGNVTGMFNRHGRAAETQAWIERVKTTAISEILFYGVLALASAMGVILLFVFLEWILWGSDASPTPGTPGTPPVVPPPAPAPAPAPAPGAPGTCPGTYFAALPVWLVQLIELFTFYMLASTMLKRGLAWWDKNYGGTSFDRNREDDDDEEY